MTKAIAKVLGILVAGWFGAQIVARCVWSVYRTYLLTGGQ